MIVYILLMIVFVIYALVQLDRQNYPGVVFYGIGVVLMILALVDGSNV